MWKKIFDGAKETASNFVRELRLIFSDAGAVLLFVIAMFIYPLLYAIGYEKEVVRDIPVAVVDLDHSSTSRQYSRMADATEQLSVYCKPGSVKEAEQLFYKGNVKGVILIPANFEKDIMSVKQSSITVYCDASYFLLYKQVFSGASFSSATMGAGIEIKRLIAEGKSTSQAYDMQDPIKVDVYNLYNPSGGYGSLVMPGMILIIMQQTLLIGIGMLGGTIRERKIFLKMTGRSKHHLGSVRLVFGKAAAYTFVYLFNALFALVILYKWFSFPDKGSVLDVLILFIPFLLSVSFLGLAISMLFKERAHSMMFMVFLSPLVVFLSGISWPTSAIPPALYGLAHIFPSTYVVPAYIKVRTCGASISDVRYEVISLFVQALFYFVLACLSYRYSIRRFGKRVAEKSNKSLKID